MVDALMGGLVGAVIAGAGAWLSFGRGTATREELEKLEGVVGKLADVQRDCMIAHASLCSRFEEYLRHQAPRP